MKSVADSLGFQRMWKMGEGVYTVGMIMREFHCSRSTAKAKLDKAVEDGEWIAGFVVTERGPARAYCMKGTKVEYG